jgi:carboxyl-terminal processing protease
MQRDPQPEERGGGRRRARRRPTRASVGASVLTLVAILGLFAAGLWFGGHPSALPGFMREAFEAGNGSEVTAEAINEIASSYYRPVKRSALDGASIEGAVASLNDPFSHYLSPSEYRNFASAPRFSGVGVEVASRPAGLLIERVFDSSPAKRAGLRSGELIVAVDGHSLRGVSEQAAHNMIVGPPGTDVRLTIQQGSARRTVTITRELVTESTVASEMRTVGGRKLAVLALASFSAGAHGELAEALQGVLRRGAQGIVLDLRHNGGGLVSEARLVASLFIRSGTIVSMHARTQRSLTLYATGEPLAPSLPMVVLVDRDTASAAEIVTAALQDHRRATVVGTHTFGKGVFQELEPLRNGGALDITVGEYLTPNGRNLGGGGVREGAGVTPEVKVASAQIDTEAGLDVALRTLRAKLR